MFIEEEDLFIPFILLVDPEACMFGGVDGESRVIFLWLHEALDFLLFRALHINIVINR